MESTRDISRDSAISRLLILDVLRRGRVSGRIKFQKLVFLVDYWGLRSKEALTIPVRFIRYDHGPFSQDAWDYLDQLCDRGLARQDGYAYHLTDEGRELVDCFMQLLGEDDDNGDLLAHYRGVLAKYSRDFGNTLRDYVYALPSLRNSGITISDVPYGHTVISPKDGVRRLSVPAAVVEDLIDILGPSEVDEQILLREAAERVYAEL